MAEHDPLKILVLAAEVAPFAKTGGLADVVGSLPKAVSALGHDVRVAMPRYARIDPAKFELKEVVPAFDVPMNRTTEPAQILQGTISPDVPVYLVDNARYFDRPGIYMYPDDADRFIFFCRAILESLKQIDWQPDVIHCHDWHTAIVPNWLNTIYRNDPFFANTATVYTIHNLAYQGIFGYRVLEIAGLDEWGFQYHPEMADLNEVVDLMGRGIYWADLVSTVSPTYAQEILTPEYGERLDPLLRDRRDRLFGILNGIDYDTADPATDPYIAVGYDTSTLDRRFENKLALQREARLPENPDIPLLGIVSRLTDSKGLDIVSQIVAHVLDLGVQMVVMGTGEQSYHEVLSRMAQDYPDQMAIFLTFNTPLQHKIFAGSDIFLMPSRVEPSGTSQLMAMHYGSVPVVRATGGLADTVEDYNPRTGQGHGFVFGDYDAWMLFAAVVRAVETFKHREVWRQIQRRGMSVDHSWQRSAGKYVDLYRRALASRMPRPGIEKYQVKV
ncbi:MAG TPA: glycogen/starch synthase [Anaerolineae bacterium]|nr:glycogen/starch synthase [Anaerolineae bacterium]